MNHSSGSHSETTTRMLPTGAPIDSCTAAVDRLAERGELFGRAAAGQRDLHQGHGGSFSR
jgi:hypothetical protein